MKILNLYAGIGGNRKLWSGHDITAVEYNKEIADIYKTFYPEDKVIIDDAHKFLEEHHSEFDFIWSSPPCQSHSRVRMMASKSGSYSSILPNMNLYSEIIFLQHFYKGKWVVENVKPYYEPLIKPTIFLDRHNFWSNFYIEFMDFEKPKVKHNKVTGKTDRYGINLQGFSLKTRKDQIIRNCVNPELGLYILQQAQQDVAPKV
jgi:DNA (cytosine-5)-methyltransferase 1